MARKVGQSNLFDDEDQPQYLNKEPIARHADPVSSQLAAEKVTKSGRRSGIKWKIESWMRGHAIDCARRALTSHEIHNRMGLPDRDFANFHKRLPDLRADDIVTNGPKDDSVFRLCTVSGNKCLVWWIK